MRLSLVKSVCLREDDRLVVSIESKILNVSGFPVVLSKDDDVLKSINKALATKA